MGQISRPMAATVIFVGNAPPPPPPTSAASASTALLFNKPFPRLWPRPNPSTFSISRSSSSSSSSSRIPVNSSNRVCAFLFNPAEEPILQQAFKEPVAFLGGMFAGVLRLDLNDEPLKEWVTRTVEASGITDEVIKSEESNVEQVPEQIEIE